MCNKSMLALPYLTDTCSKHHNRTTIHVHTNEIPGAHGLLVLHFLICKLPVPLLTPQFLNGDML